MVRLREQQANLAKLTAMDDEGDRRARHRRHAEEIDALLDSGIGQNWLSQPEIAEVIVSALKHFDQVRYRLHAWVVMPNHVHAVVEPVGAQMLPTILHTWKSFTAKRANRLLGLEGQSFWQRESYDHWVRGPDELAACIRYTVGNPVKARLCQKAEAWRWSSAWNR